MADEAKGSNSVEFGLTPDGKLVIDGESFDIEEHPDGSDEEHPPTDSSGERTSGEEAGEGESPAEEEKAAGQDEAVKEEPRYTPEEIREIGLDKLDPKRLPPEMVPYYKSLQADYTRKTQLLADERRILEAAKAKEPQAEPAASTADGEQPGGKEAESPFKVIVAAAKALACTQFLGIRPEEFDEYNMEHTAALQAAMRQLEGEAARAAEREQQVARQVTDFATLCAQYRDAVPEFDEIANGFFPRWIESKPYRKYNEVIGVFKSGTIPEIKKVIDEVISDWRNEEGAKPKEKIPAVESAKGTSLVGAPGKAGSSAKALGEMTSDEQAEWLVKNRLV